VKILYDQQIFSFQDYGGISRYLYELIRRVKKTENKVLIDGKFSNNIYLKKIKNDTLSFLPSFRLPHKNILNFYANIFFDSYFLKSGNFDIFHATYFHPYFLNMLKAKPYVLTVHDMIPELVTNQFKGMRSITTSYKREVVLKANYIIAVSENTKRDIVRLYGIDGNRIKVIYHGNPLEGVVPSKVSGLPDRYFLFVGNRAGYKNFTFFVQAIRPILEKDKKLFLVCAGGGSFSASEKIFLSQLGVEKQVVQIGFKSDSELAYIYKKALVYILPSLYEGFGLTVLEALSMGCPVVASDTSSIPEVCGKAVVFVNPRDSDSIRQGVLDVLEDSKLRDKLVKLGFTQVKKFSWEIAVKETLSVYQKVLNGV